MNDLSCVYVVQMYLKLVSSFSRILYFNPFLVISVEQQKKRGGNYYASKAWLLPALFVPCIRKSRFSRLFSAFACIYRGQQNEQI